MWILDSAYRDGGVDLWIKEDATVKKVHYAYDPPFYVRFHDPAACHEMIAALEEQYGAEECSIRTIFGALPGYAVHAGREVAEAIERQAQYGADFFNVDVRRDQRFMAERGMVPCTGEREDRFSPVVGHDLLVLELRVRDDPAPAAPVLAIDAAWDGQESRIEGKTEDVLDNLGRLLASCDPDVILMPDADMAMPRLLALARQHGVVLPFSRNGKYRKRTARSYWSYGRMEHTGAALLPDGRILIDTEQSFVYREGGLPGVIMAARLSGIPPGPASRFTPGTLISSYEVREAVRQGIAVPFRKNDHEQVRRMAALRAADRGGLIFQPVPGTYEAVGEIDFTSLYPSIIVHENLSPDTFEHREQPGFLPAVLRPVIELRRTVKRQKKTDPRLAGTDAVLKWMLVTSFGYTGYKNAKFGRIEVHEAITAASREILLRTKEIAEEMGFSVLHGIVDCLWVQGNLPVGALKEEVERETGYPLEIEHFDWIVFLPLADGFGAYNRYYGRLPDGSIRVRGIAARRHDTPPYVKEMQCRMLGVMKRAKTIAELAETKGEMEEIFSASLRALPAANPEQMAIGRRISRLSYRHQCLEGAAVQAYREQGIALAPGIKIRYVVEDARRYRAVPVRSATTFDLPFYRTLLCRARDEIVAAYPSAAQEKRVPAWSGGGPVRKSGPENATLF
ncbi:type B DNA-directed DNA polymerase [Methanoregula sp.]|uniref:type B DNA-directed DNA polymerase n=1 Tax=Methanoregula sp. TaxID=2052170 RepID=UPI002C4C3B1F|nr:type B DNA-directed DNA polymerase [Methanoregula sp.]HVP96033.1 type B DNA-directed DNA polymerase [Methanoregula sp.]